MARCAGPSLHLPASSASPDVSTPSRRAPQVPKAFKVIPNLQNWEEILYLTEPENWTPHAVYQVRRRRGVEEGWVGSQAGRGLDRCAVPRSLPPGRWLQLCVSAAVPLHTGSAAPWHASLLYHGRPRACL